MKANIITLNTVNNYGFEIIKQKPLLGYGYRNSATVTLIPDIYNSQNGVMQIIIDCEILGLASYVWMIYKSMFHKTIKPINSWPFFIFLYAMIIGSSVEITLTNTLVFVSIAMVNAANVNYNDQLNT